MVDSNAFALRLRSRLNRFVGSTGRLLFLNALLLLAACDLAPMPPTPTPDPVQSALRSLPAAIAVNIRDDWAGLSPVAPILAHYFLRPAPGGGLQGTADFAAGEYRGTPITATETIDIPAEVTKRFFDKLATSALVEGPYEPAIDHTDDYPSVTISIQTDSGTVTFYSQSQGEEHVPWAADLRNKTYVIDAPTPNEALEILGPHLKRDVLEKVVDQASRRTP